MAENVIRQDIIQLGFDIDLSGLKKVNDEMDDLKKNISGVGSNDGIDNLKKETDKAKNSVNGLGKETDKATDSVDGLGKKTDKAKNSLTGLGKVSVNQLSGGLSKLDQKLTSVAKKAAGATYTGLKKLAGISFKALGVGAGAVSAIMGNAVKDYANFEQQIGGVETLFKKDANIVQKYANDAFKTAGLSANDYMETVTGFAASLLQSVGGDTEKAAKYADVAITDMADNANKMGTGMESIQYAYQGFAKQNYTMLDNLKLGYGGTKSEMQRLVKDAAKLDKSIDASSLSYGNIVKAIHAVQKNLGITGTTAKEAEKTISGSLYAMKSAWGNLMPALIQGGDSFDQCVDNLVSSVKTFAGNIMPAIKKGLSGVGSLIEELSPILAKELPSMFNSLLPSLIKSAVSLVKGLASAVPKIIPTLVTSVIQAIYEGFTGEKMSGDMFASLKQNVQSAFNAIKQIVQGVIQFTSQLMTALAPVLSWVGNLALTVFTWIGNNINWLLPIVGALVGVFLAYKAVLLVVNIITGIVTAAQTIMGVVCGTSSAAAAAGTTAVGTAAATSAPQILAFAAAILAVGVAILAICVGFALLVQASISLTNAGWGAIAVMGALIVIIVALAVGAAALAPALTVGAVGLIAFGGAIALVGAGALMAAMGLSVMAGALPTIVQFGAVGAVSIMALGAGLTIFAVGAVAAGVAALALSVGLVPLMAVVVVVAASTALFAASMALVAVSMAIITAMISGFVAMLSMLPALFAALVPQVLIFSATMTPLVGVVAAALVPLTAFTALIAVLAVSFTVLAVASALMVVSFGAINVLLVAMVLLLTIVNIQLRIISTAFTAFGTSAMSFIAVLAQLATALTAAVVPLTAFTALSVVLAASFSVLAIASMLVVVAFTAINALLGVMMLLLTIINVNLLMISSTFPIVAASSAQFAASLIPLVTAMTIVIAPLTAFTALVTVLAASFTVLAVASTVVLIAFTGITAILTTMLMLMMIINIQLILLNGLFTSIAASAIVLTAALLPLSGIFTALIAPATAMVAILTPLAGAFTKLALTAVVFLGAVTGLITKIMMLTLLFSMLVAVVNRLAMVFTRIGNNIVKLTALFIPFQIALMKICTPLAVVSTRFMKFATALIFVVAGTKAINSKFLVTTILLKTIVKLLGALLLLLNGVSNAFKAIAKAPEIFNVALNNMANKGISTTQKFVNVLRSLLITTKLIVAQIAMSISNIVDNSINNIVKKITQLPKKMGDGIRSAGKSLSSALVEVWEKAVKASVSPVNKVIDGANWILKQFGSDKKVVSWTPYAKGTDGHKGGNALVNDGKGAELVQMPNGQSFIPQGRNVFIPNAPKGMKVLSAERTAQLFGRKSPTFRYADGIGDIDVFSYIDNAKGLVSKIKDGISYDGINGLGRYIGKGMVDTITSQMPSWFDKLVEEMGAVNYDASQGVKQWKATVIRALKMEGQYSPANVARTLYQMQTESGGNPRAINLWDSNAKKGTPSKGLMQVIDPTFATYARAGFDKNIYDPLSNILASIRYAKSRYGSLANAFKGHGYANGGVATKPSIFGEDGSEMAIPLSQSKRQRGVNLWEKTGSLLGVDFGDYTPENSGYVANTTTIENNSYSPQFTLNVNGASDDRALKRKIKQWISEAMEETFEGIGRVNNVNLQEV